MECTRKFKGSDHLPCAVMWEGCWRYRLHWGLNVLPVMTLLLMYGISVSPHSVHAYIKGNGEKTRVQAHTNPQEKLNNSS